MVGNCKLIITISHRPSRIYSNICILFFTKLKISFLKHLKKTRLDFEFLPDQFEYSDSNPNFLTKRFDLQYIQIISNTHNILFTIRWLFELLDFLDRPTTNFSPPRSCQPSHRVFTDSDLLSRRRFHLFFPPFSLEPDTRLDVLS